MATTIKARRRFQHPEWRYERTLAYRFADKRQKHQVIRYLPPGEDMHPVVDEFDTIEAAREGWARIQNKWKASGMVVVN